MEIEKGKPMLIGKAAKSAGVSIRTLQHYDRIGLLPASGRLPDGKRFYTESDLLKLERILFYRSLGIPLQQMKPTLESEASADIEKILQEQELSIYSKIEDLYSVIGAIQAARPLHQAGLTPPWGTLSTLIQKLSGKDFSQWEEYQISIDEKKQLMNFLQSTEHAIALFHDLKKCLIKAATYQAAGLPPDAPLAQELREEWDAFGTWIAREHPELIDIFARLGEQQHEFDEAFYAGALAFLESVERFEAADESIV